MLSCVNPPPAPKDGCIFCQIVAGAARSHQVWEDDDTVVFMDLFPAAEGHTLIIPKPHWENLFETPVLPLQRVIRISKSVAFALRAVFAPDGISVFQVNGAAAGQTVFHYHMHLIPRTRGTSLRLQARQPARRETLDEQARRIRRALPSPLL